MLVCIGAALGMVYSYGYDKIILSAPKSYDGKAVSASIEATDYSFETDACMCVNGTAVIGEDSFPVRLYYYDDILVKPGDVLQGSFLFRYTGEGGQMNSTYHKGDGIFALAFVTDLRVRPAISVPAKYAAADMRRTIAQQIDMIFPADTAFFAKALLLGDDSDLGFQENMIFRKSGIRHVIAVSGLHVSILFSIIYTVTARKRFWSLLIGLPVLLLFAAVAGFAPSVVRACLMQALILVASAFNREYDRATGLAFAVMVMLLYNPLAVTSASLQMSVACMIGIFAFSDPIRNYLLDDKRLGKWAGKGWKGKLIRWTINSVAMSVSTMILTLPLCAVHFGMVSVVGILTNLLTLWIVLYVFCGIMLAGILSAFWLPLGTAVAAAVSVMIRYILLIAQAMSQLPFGVGYTQSIYIRLWIVATYVLILLFFLSKKKRPILLTGTIVAGYALSLFATWLEPRMDQVRMTMIDVGQGQCILLQSGDSAYMVDCGGEHPKNAAEQAICWLGAQGVYQLDGLILTHFDTDHANGAAYLMDTIAVEALYIPAVTPSDPMSASLLNRKIDYHWVKEETVVSCGQGILRIFPAQSKESGNESSMCILFQGENCDILITGDRDLEGEQQLLLETQLPELEILVAGHHGSQTATGWPLLQATKPDTVLISVGQDNSHGHPAQETLLRLLKAGCIIRRTDLEGTIVIRR